MKHEEIMLYGSRCSDRHRLHNSLIQVHAGGTMMNACVSPVSSTCPSLGFSSNDQITKGDNE